MSADTLEGVREKLQEIAEGRGPFSRDQLTHASNTIDHAKALAVEIIATLDRMEVVAWAIVEPGGRPYANLWRSLPEKLKPAFSVIEEAAVNSNLYNPTVESALRELHSLLVRPSAPDGLREALKEAGSLADWECGWRDACANEPHDPDGRDFDRARDRFRAEIARAPQSGGPDDD